MDWIKWVVNILERQRKPTTVDITNSRFGRIMCCTFFGFFPLARQHHQWLNVLLGRSDLKIKSLVVVLLLDINQYVPLHAHSYYVTTLDGECIWTLERQQKRLSSQLLWIKPKNNRREHFLHSYYVTTLDGKCIWTLERQQKRLSSQLLWIKPKNSRREHSPTVIMQIKLAHIINYTPYNFTIILLNHVYYTWWWWWYARKINNKFIHVPLN